MNVGFMHSGLLINKLASKVCRKLVVAFNHTMTFSLGLTHNTYIDEKEENTGEKYLKIHSLNKKNGLKKG